MNEKYNDKYESQIAQLADNRLKTNNYNIFDYQARVYSRKNLPELIEQGRTTHSDCLVLINREGETIAITREFETILVKALKNRE